MKKNLFEKSSGKSWGTLGKSFENFIFNKRVYIFIPLDAVFHGDHEYEVLLAG
jgi:hypothetical protein